MKIDGTDWQEVLKKTDEQNKTENEIIKKRLSEINNLVCDLLEQWDKWHLKSIENLLKDKTKDIERLLNDAFELNNPDKDILGLIYCLGHSKQIINNYVKSGLEDMQIQELLKR